MLLGGGKSDGSDRYPVKRGFPIYRSLSNRPLNHHSSTITYRSIYGLRFYFGKESQKKFEDFVLYALQVILLVEVGEKSKKKWFYPLCQNPLYILNTTFGPPHTIIGARRSPFSDHF